MVKNRARLSTPLRAFIEKDFGERRPDVGKLIALVDETDSIESSNNLVEKTMATTPLENRMKPSTKNG